MTYESVEFHRLVCGCAILVLGGVSANPEVEIVFQLLQREREREREK